MSLLDNLEKCRASVTLLSALSLVCVRLGKVGSMLVLSLLAQPRTAKAFVSCYV